MLDELIKKALLLRNMKLTSEDLNAFPTAIGARLFVRLMAILSPFSSVPSQYALIVIRVCYYRD